MTKYTNEGYYSYWKASVRVTAYKAKRIVGAIFMEHIIAGLRTSTGIYLLHFLIYDTSFPLDLFSKNNTNMKSYIIFKMWVHVFWNCRIASYNRDSINIATIYENLEYFHDYMMHKYSLCIVK